MKRSEYAIDGPLPTVVIAEDDDDLRRLTLRQLQSFGFDSIVACPTGMTALEEILEILDRGECVIVLTDNEMPDGTGVDLLEALLLEDETPSSRFVVIMLSGREPDRQTRERLFSWLPKGHSDRALLRHTMEAATKRLTPSGSN